jgi:hypothetical protein
MKCDLEDKFNGTVVGYKSFTAYRNKLMLDIYVNGERRYEFGPFENRQQRQALLIKLRRLVSRQGQYQWQR